MKYFTTEELLKNYRDDAHEILEKCVGKSVKDNFAFQVFEKYHGEYFDTKNQRILDLGPASGGFVRQIYGAGHTNVAGVDLDDYRDKDNKNLFREFKTADLSWEQIPWPDAFFEIVTAWCVLPHLENPFYAAREVHRVLQKDGIFIMTTPYLTSKPSIDYFVKNHDFGSYRASNNHLVLFTRGLVEKTILRYFDLADVEYHFRTKIFEQGTKGKLRRALWRLAGLFGSETRKKLARRWAHNVVYILRKKDL